VEIYKLIFGYYFEEAQKHFVESLAAYSLVMYLLQVKDRYSRFDTDTTATSSSTRKAT
jgi:hypothetical protein